MFGGTIISIKGNEFVTDNPFYPGPYISDRMQFKIGDKIYFSSELREWVTDHVIKLKGDKNG